MTSTPVSNLWQVSIAQRAETQPFSNDQTVDLAIIGGGFTGCAAALEAARLGASVTVLEAETIGHGGSGRNVGLVNAGLWLPPNEITEALGEDVGRRLIDTLAEGPSRVFDIIARESIDCEATRSGTLHLAHAPSGLKDLENRFRQGNQLGAPIQLLDAAEARRRTGSEAFQGALFDPRAGTIQPLAYCHGLARAAIAAGATLHDQSAVTAIRHQDDTWHLSCNGHTLRARHLLLATNAYHAALSAPFRPAYVPVHYSQFATAPLPENLRTRILPGGEGCWDTALVMSSIRIDTAGRLIVGGMGDSDGPGKPVHAAWARRKLRALYPELADIPFEHAWSGRIAMTSDHIPKVLSIGPRAFAVFGYSGRGISPGTVFGSAAAEALLQDRPEALPVPPQAAHSEALTGLKQAYYEFGATLTHAIRPSPLG